MADFDYTAIDKMGQRIQASISAENEFEANKKIKEMDMYIIEIKAKSKVDMEIGGGVKKIKNKDLFVFCRQFSTMLNSGLTVLRALEIIVSQTTNKRIKSVYQDVYDQIQMGNPMYKSMAAQGDCFPPYLVSSIESGEASGNIDGVMAKMADHFDKQNKIKSKIKSAMIYPIILAVVALLVVTFLLIFIVPTFVQMFDSAGSELPGLTQFLLDFSNFLKNNILIIIAVIIILSYGLVRFKKTERGKYLIDELLLKLPVFGKLNKIILTSTFARTMATLTSSGISLLKAIEISIRVVDNGVVAEKLKLVLNDLNRGKSLSSSIEQLEFFPDMFTSMLTVGEESGAIEDILNKTADFYDEESDSAISSMVGMLEPIMIVFMGGAVGFIVIAMLLPMFGMYNNIT